LFLQAFSQPDIIFSDFQHQRPGFDFDSPFREEPHFLGAAEPMVGIIIQMHSGLTPTSIAASIALAKRICAIAVGEEGRCNLASKLPANAKCAASLELGIWICTFGQAFIDLDQIMKVRTSFLYPTS
jgi:hypothetical protein